MDLDQLGPEARNWLRDVLGYLNLSSGVPDPGFLRSLNLLFGQVARLRTAHAEPAWRLLRRVLESALVGFGGQTEAFRQVEQAEAVLRLVFDVVLPGYRHHHRDLLFHQTEETLFQPFFIGRVCEAVLAEGPPWDQAERILQGALARLNDFIGYRPVAVLHTAQKIEPYPHEKLRPIPLYIRDAGVAVGRYHDLVEQALEILRTTDPDLLEQAWFDPGLLDELAMDPRAYDFDHPVNRRPNYQFGTWDPHQMDQRGYYRRYVVQEVTLEALWSRLEQRGQSPYEEVLFEAAAALAGTILMGSAITGDRPDAHDSATTLSRLVVHVAAFRDAFYERLLGHVSGPHGERLRQEARILRQPFGGARQHLNQALARRRARQMQHVHLARLFAKMGYTEAALREAQVVPVASARMRCEIDCRIAAAHLALQQGQLEAAAAFVPEIEDLLHRAIQCGAMVDPWNILGFGGQFSRFPAVEDSAHDERIDELIELVETIFNLYARLQRRAAAAGHQGLFRRLAEQQAALARWWDQFASTEVSGVKGVSGWQACQSARQVAEALGAWHQAGTAAGNVAFWRRYAQRFRSPEAFACLIDALLEHGDLVAARALLVHWAGQSSTIPLAQGNHSFHSLARRWMERVWSTPDPSGPQPDQPTSGHAGSTEPRWLMARKFLDQLEANAEEFWTVPRLELDLPPAGSLAAASGDLPVPEDSEDLYRAAYENVVYRDTTDDGFEGELLDWSPQPSDFELAAEAERISGRLSFLVTVARLWKLAAAGAMGCREAIEDRDEVLAGWLSEAAGRCRQLEELLGTVHRYPIPPARATHDSLVEFDRRRQIKEALLERIISAGVETADAARVLQAVVERQPAGGPDDWQGAFQSVLAAAHRGDREGVRAGCGRLFGLLARQPLLYLPLSRGGNPGRVLQVRNLQQALRWLLGCLPRLGLLAETYRLVETIRQMEHDHPIGPMAITEFDRLLELACRGIVQCLVRCCEAWDQSAAKAGADRRHADAMLLSLVQEATALLLRPWLAHSQHVRLSVLEGVAEEPQWRALRRFIQRYGAELFTQRFLTYGNLRAILHQGVEGYLRSLEEQPEAEAPRRLLEDLDTRLPRHEAVRWLELTLEAVLENYTEYLDYNSTTTQSDRGELLYMFLDFLRLKARYDRVAWNLQPLVVAHQVLVRSGRVEAADQWRQAVARESSAVADHHLHELERLVARYGIRLRSVADRLRERFVQPLAVDRLCCLVRPAIEDLRLGRQTIWFGRLQQELGPFTAEPEGVGFELPAWLEALDREVALAAAGTAPEEDSSLAWPAIPPVRLSLEEIRSQLRACQQ